MSSRDKILSNIRQSLTSSQENLSPNDERKQATERRINSHPRGIIPDRNSKHKLLRLFREKVEASEASYSKVRSYVDAGTEIQQYLRQHNLPQCIRMGNDKRFNKLKWGKGNSPQIQTGPSDGQDLVCLSHAQSGVCETGTLVLTSGPDNPTSLNFLPETHIILVNKKDLQENYEDSWKALRRRFGKGKLSRTLNMITGPSRSADIEQTLILGAHGPLRLHVIVVDEAK